MLLIHSTSQSVTLRNRGSSALCTQLLDLWLHNNQTMATLAFQKLFSSQSLNHPVCNTSTVRSAPVQVIYDAAVEWIAIHIFFAVDKDRVGWWSVCWLDSRRKLNLIWINMKIMNMLIVSVWCPLHNGNNTFCFSCFKMFLKLLIKQ